MESNARITHAIICDKAIVGKGATIGRGCGKCTVVVDVAAVVFVVVVVVVVVTVAAVVVGVAVAFLSPSPSLPSPNLHSHPFCSSTIIIFIII